MFRLLSGSSLGNHSLSVLGQVIWGCGFVQLAGEWRSGEDTGGCAIDK